MIDLSPSLEAAKTAAKTVPVTASSLALISWADITEAGQACVVLINLAFIAWQWRRAARPNPVPDSGTEKKDQ